MEKILHDSRPPDAIKIGSSRKVSTRLAVAAFAGILVFYTTTLKSTGNAIGAIHHAPIAANSTSAARVFDGPGDDDELSAEAVAAATAGSAPEGSDGDALLAWPAKKPNEGRTQEGSAIVRLDTGVRSPHYGDIQRHHQEWLTRKAQQLSLRLRNSDRGADALTRSGHPDDGSGAAGEGGASLLEGRSKPVGGGGRGPEVERKTQDAGGERRSLTLYFRGAARAKAAAAAASQVEVEDRIERVNTGARLWGETYVPPIEPARRQELIDKWTGKTWSPPENARQPEKGQNTTRTEPPMGRILYVISSFDRGQRLGKQFTNKLDKLDFVLLMLDEMREACEVGFSPEVHLLAAWDASVMIPLVQDRLFCKRTGRDVPFSFQEYPHSIGNKLSAKHRIYMKDRLELFDIFLQVEDDMILTLNHILNYQEECELLDNRITSTTKPTENTFVPGLIRVEPGMGEGGEVDGDTWVEWEIILSRFFPTKIRGAGTYLTLRKSIPVPTGGEYGGNNQGMWIATREQLRKLSEGKRCKYLDFGEDTRKGNPETHSGSLQMFSKDCGFDKVFPATHFEDFLVHHRANNKAGRRGESIPGVPIRTLREWVEQFIRDESFLEPHD